MGTQVSVVLNDKVSRYVKIQEAVRNKSAAELVADLLNEWYEARVQDLHGQYLAGALTLRGMARQLGLSYRELYDMLEKRELAL